MKKFILILLSALFIGSFAAAEEYTVLNPPAISIMDFEVDVESLHDIETDTVIDKGYLGSLLNHTLTTVLIQQNSSNNLVVDNARYYFPPLLKIFDKKYVEMALQKNSYDIQDLYSVNTEAFKFSDLDFVVLGNIYRTRMPEGNQNQNYYGVNVRILNTKRAEELYSYNDFILEDLSNLNEICLNISNKIIRDLVNSHCGQFVIKDRTNKTDDYLLFCQSDKVLDDSNMTVNSDDYDKQEVGTNAFYWLLPGEYTFTVYNKLTQSIKTIPLNCHSGEITQIQIEQRHLEVPRGNISITGISEDDSYVFVIKEEERKTEYQWEIGQNFENLILDRQVVFGNGELWYPPSRNDNSDFAEYLKDQNELVFKDLYRSNYTIQAVMLPYYTKSRESITGTLRVPLQQLAVSDAIEINLKDESDIELSIFDFKMMENKEIDVFKNTSITFFLYPAFNNTIEMHFNDGIRNNVALPLNDIEKIIVEGEYTEEEWNLISDFDISFTTPVDSGENGEELEVSVTVPKKEMEPGNDKIEFIDFFNDGVLIRNIVYEEPAPEQKSIISSELLNQKTVEQPKVFPEEGTMETGTESSGNSGLGILGVIGAVIFVILIAASSGA